MSADRSWMYRRLDRGALTNEFRLGVTYFLNFAYSNRNFVSIGDQIRCPCRICSNGRFLDRETVTLHLYTKGFAPRYFLWTCHGESREVGTSSNPVVQTYGESSSAGASSSSQCNPYRTMILDSLGGQFHLNDNVDRPVLQTSVPPDTTAVDITEVGAAVEIELPNKEAAEFYEMLKAADEPLYENCPKYTRFSAMTQLLNIKADCNISGVAYDRIAGLINGMLPTDNKFEPTFYKTKKLMRKLGLGYEKIHACQNNCILYYKENVQLDKCPVCQHPRYKEKKSVRQKNIPFKVLRYFPLTPRLQRLFMSEKTAPYMSWHARSRDDTVMTHPSDSEAWKHLDTCYPSFARDTRNIRLGLCTDGFNPFGHSATPYSVWPVLLTVYNLPPSMCMKDEFIYLSMIIPGPKGPRKEIDIFLRPLIDELKTLWTEGAVTYDCHRKQNFNLKAAVLWTINDFPAYGMLSGWSTHGRLSCPYCMEHSKSISLQNGRKISFFDCHRRFLPVNHQYRRNRNKFTKGRVERDGPPPMLSGEQMLARVSALPDIVFGRNERVSGFGQTHNWVKKSIFWELPYWSSLLIRHNLDVMHIEKNVFDNIFNTLMDISGKTKDNVKARHDLKILCKRPELELQEVNGRYLKPKALYVLNKQQIKDVCQWVKELRLPDGYASNLSRCVNVDDCKISGMKSHDCHVFMQRLLPIAFRDLLPDNIWGPLTELSMFFRSICANVLRVEDMSTLENNIVEIICKLEQFFPPAFFDSMEHLPIHLAYEARVGGPVQYRWMYLFERYMNRLKKKVKNTAAVEGSISESYIIQEISTFCSFYFESTVQTRFDRLPRNDDGGVRHSDGRLNIFCHSGRAFGSRPSRHLSDEEYHLAHLYVLLNCPEIEQFIEIFDIEMVQKYSIHNDQELERLRNRDFPTWIQTYSKDHRAEIDERIFEFVSGPSRLVSCYSGYFVNGYKFHTVEYSFTKKTMNAGVCVKGTTYVECDMDFYGLVEEVIELHYFGLKSVILFRCHWFDTTERGMKVHPKYKLVEVNYKSKLAANEPFILASQAEQVYYAKYPARNKDRADWRVVCKTKGRGKIDPIVGENELIPDMTHGFYQEDDPPAVDRIIPILEDADTTSIQLEVEYADDDDHEIEEAGDEEDEEEEEEEEFEDYYSDDDE